MYITELAIKNFRAISDISVALNPRCNVIVGPNATGKTTILEAIRLAKGLAAPRTQHETNQILTSLGASTPGLPNRLYFPAIAGNDKKSISITCTYKLESQEIALLKERASVAAMANQIVLQGMGRQFANPAELIGILSSPIGLQNQEAFSGQLRGAIAEIESGARQCILNVNVDPNSQVTSSDVLGGVLIAFLDRRLPPGKTLFSYFTADRAIPTQDQPVQIGTADAVSQMESYNSQPQLKYTRLKHTIFNSVLSGNSDQQTKQFAAIFSKVLRGKTLKTVGINDHGALKISIEDDETKCQFSIDAMSSGEKGLILTCLLIAQSMETGGIVLLDEPELHLNPAVCRDVLNFLIAEYAEPSKLQLVLCSHSPEILGAAFERDDCELFHLISGTLLTPVRRQDLEEVEGALRRLGASPSESLLYKGTVFVEGDHDSEVLEEGFKNIFQRYKIRDLGGRLNVEREVQLLQEREKSANNIAKTFFILDKDDEPTKLRSSSEVRVLQWGRRCLENYLLDVNTLTDIVKSSANALSPLTNVASVQQLLKQLAFSQIDERVGRQIYQASRFANMSLTNREMKDRTFAEFADAIFQRISSVKEQFALFDEARWKAEFVTACENRKLEMEQDWENSWVSECDGKRLLREFHAATKVREGLLRFKLRIIGDMAANGSESWLTMQSLLSALMK